jgi:glycine/betaine/sarcosine/D-proline reductase family selenoprotein B
VAVISALPPLAMQAGANRVVQGIKIEHVCGDPTQTPELDRRLRRRLVERSLAVLQASVSGPTLFHPDGGA